MLFAKSLLQKTEVKTIHQQREGDIEVKGLNWFASHYHKLFMSGNLFFLSQESASLMGETHGGMTGYQPCPRNQTPTQKVKLGPTTKAFPGSYTEEPRLTSIFLPIPPFPFGHNGCQKHPFQGQKLNGKICNSEFLKLL